MRVIYYSGTLRSKMQEYHNKENKKQKWEIAAIIVLVYGLLIYSAII